MKKIIISALILLLSFSAIAEYKTISNSIMRSSPTSSPAVHRIDADGVMKTLNFTLWSGDLFK